MAKKTAPAVKKVDDILKAMLVFARTVDNVLEQRAVEHGVGEVLSASKVQILRLLGQRGAQTASQVSRYLGVSKPAVTQLIDVMVASRVVSRKTATEDRREIRLQLTKKGRESFQAIRRSQRHYVRNSLRNVSGARADAWIKSIHEVSESLARADDAFEHFCAQCGAHEDGTCVLVGGDATCLFLKYTGTRARRHRKAAAG